MARLNNYRYEYKKQNYMQKPDYTTDITLKVYVRYKGDRRARHPELLRRCTNSTPAKTAPTSSATSS